MKSGSAIAADGTSIIAPSGMSSATSKPSLRSFEPPHQRAADVRISSSRLLTIGTSARTGP
jgi:hypothetical protein